MHLVFSERSRVSTSTLEVDMLVGYLPVNKSGVRNLILVPIPVSETDYLFVGSLPTHLMFSRSAELSTTMWAEFVRFLITGTTNTAIERLL